MLIHYATPPYKLNSEFSLGIQKFGNQIRFSAPAMPEPACRQAGVGRSYFAKLA
jgi:hypothetical protein